MLVVVSFEYGKSIAIDELQIALYIAEIIRRWTRCCQVKGGKESRLQVGREKTGHEVEGLRRSRWIWYLEPRSAQLRRGRSPRFRPPMTLDSGTARCINLLHLTSKPTALTTLLLNSIFNLSNAFVKCFVDFSCRLEMNCCISWIGALNPWFLPLNPPLTGSSKRLHGVKIDHVLLFIYIWLRIHWSRKQVNTSDDTRWQSCWPNDFSTEPVESTSLGSSFE